MLSSEILNGASIKIWRPGSFGTVHTAIYHENGTGLRRWKSPGIINNNSRSSCSVPEPRMNWSFVSSQPTPALTCTCHDFKAFVIILNQFSWIYGEARSNHQTIQLTILFSWVYLHEYRKKKCWIPFQFHPSSCSLFWRWCVKPIPKRTITGLPRLKYCILEASSP